MPSDPAQPPNFPATRWSMVLAASGTGARAQVALEELCRLYWFPLYSFARNNGCNPEDAEDETQHFLATLTTGGLLASAMPNRGRLRTFLLAAFQHDLIDARRRAHRKKRGGHMGSLSLDDPGAEERYRIAPQLDSPVSSFDHAWAMTCFNTAIGALEAEFEARSRANLFQSLLPFLDLASEGDYVATAQSMGLSPNALRQAVFRFRQRFRIVLRQLIADTLEQPTEPLVDEELAALRAALAM